MSATNGHRGQMYTGPWLDRLFPIDLPDGRMVAVKALSVLPACNGILEGGLDPRINAMKRQEILALAEKRYGGPAVVVEPEILPVAGGTQGRPRERYPWMACMARLTSEPLDPYMISSELTLVWWQDAFALPLPAEIERAARGIDWERSAVDVDLP